CELPRASAMIERTRKRLAATSISIPSGQIRASVAAGVVEAPLGEPSAVRELISAAERALESSKESARNRTSYGAGVPPSPPVEAAQPVGEVHQGTTDPGITVG